MKSIYRIAILFLIIVILTACGESRAGLTPTVVGEVQGTPASTPAAAEVDSEAPLETHSAAVTLTDFPTETPTPIPALPTSTPTPAQAITATQILSPTASLPAAPEVITTTTWVTATWSFRDLVVIEGERLYQGAWKQDGSAFAVATSAGAFVYDAQTLERTRIFNVGEAVYAAIFHPTEGLLALGLFNGDIQWWAAEVGEYVTAFDAHLLAVRDLAFPVGSQYLVSGGDDGVVALWAPAALRTSTQDTYFPVNTWQTPDRVTSVDIHQVRQLIAAGSYQSVSIWSLNTAELLTSLPELSGWVHGIAFRPGGDTLAVIDSSDTLHLWETANWFLTHRIQLDVLQELRSLDFSPDGSTLALGGEDGRVVLWDLQANSVTDLVDGLPQPVVDLAFSPAGDLLMACYQDGTVRLWSRQP